MKPIMVYVTCATEEEARTIAHSLLKDRLVACVNILPTIQSLYWWNDAMQNDREIAFFAKTTEENIDKVIERVKNLHSYDCPCIVSLPIENGNSDFLKWITDTVKKET